MNSIITRGLGIAQKIIARGFGADKVVPPTPVVPETPRGGGPNIPRVFVRPKRKKHFLLKIVLSGNALKVFSEELSLQASVKKAFVSLQNSLRASVKKIHYQDMIIVSRVRSVVRTRLFSVSSTISASVKKQYSTNKGLSAANSEFIMRSIKAINTLNSLQVISSIDKTKKLNSINMIGDIRCQ